MPVVRCKATQVGEAQLRGDFRDGLRVRIVLTGYRFRQEVYDQYRKQALMNARVEYDLRVRVRSSESQDFVIDE